MSLIACVRPALKIGIASSAATLVKRAAPRAMPLRLMPSRPNTAPRKSRGNHSAIACCRRALAASSCALRGEQIGPALQQRGRLTRHAPAERLARRVDGTMLAALNAWSPMSTAMRCRETAASVSSGGIAARALEASVCARSTSNGVARPTRWRAVTRRSVSSCAAEIARTRVELAQRADEREVVACDVASSPTGERRARVSSAASVSAAAAAAPARRRPERSTSQETSTPTCAALRVCGLRNEVAW